MLFSPAPPTTRRVIRDKSDENWRAMRACLDAGMPNAAASRCYYSVFLAVFAYALKQGDMAVDAGESERHGRAKDVVSRRVGAVQGTLYNRIRGIRVRADYKGEYVGLDEVEELLEDLEGLRDLFLRMENQVCPAKT